jgi:hypothetical protein
MDARITRDACKTRKQARKRKSALERRDPGSRWTIGHVRGASKRPWLVVEYREAATVGAFARGSSSRMPPGAQASVPEQLSGAVTKAVGEGLRRLAGWRPRAGL